MRLLGKGNFTPDHTRLRLKKLTFFDATRLQFIPTSTLISLPPLITGFLLKLCSQLTNVSALPSFDLRPPCNCQQLHNARDAFAQGPTGYIVDAEPF